MFFNLTGNKNKQLSSLNQLSHSNLAVNSLEQESKDHVWKWGNVEINA